VAGEAGHFRSHRGQFGSTVKATVKATAMVTTTEFNPGPPFCKLAADSTFAVAEPARDVVGGPRYRLVSGLLPYFSGVRASCTEGRPGPQGTSQATKSISSRHGHA